METSDPSLGPLVTYDSLRKVASLRPTRVNPMINWCLFFERKRQWLVGWGQTSVLSLSRPQVSGYDHRSVLWRSWPPAAFSWCRHLHLCHSSLCFGAPHPRHHLHQRASFLVVGDHLHDHSGLRWRTTRHSGGEGPGLPLHPLWNPNPGASHCHHQRPVLCLLLHPEDEGGGDTPWGDDKETCKGLSGKFRWRGSRGGPKPEGCLCQKCFGDDEVAGAWEGEHPEQRRRRPVVVEPSCNILYITDIKCTIK